MFDVNKSEMLITSPTGHQIIFAGLDDVEELKSLVPAKGAITDVWIEEATEVERDSIRQLYIRQRGGDDNIPKRLTLSFNSILQSHWIYNEYFSPYTWGDTQIEYKTPELIILKTWYVHNRFLTADDINFLGHQPDKYYSDVYTWGNWGILGHVIFANWEVQDLSGMRDQFTNRRNGLHFGFSSDPAALSRSHYARNHKTIYIFDELYERGLTNDVLARDLLAKIEQDVLVCDSAEPKSIVELQREGVNAVGAIKGKDSVNFGIQWLQQQHIVIDVGCVHAQNEFRQYHWKEDKDGNAMRQPVEKNDHMIDATRYAYEGESLGSWVIS